MMKPTLPTRTASLLLFTGGRDSTAAFLEMRRTRYSPQLFTGLSPLTKDAGLRNLRIRELTDIFGPSSMLTYERPLDGALYELVLRTLVPDVLQFRRQFILLGEYIVLLLVAIMYAKEFDIGLIASGAVRYQQHLPEQHPKLLDLWRRFGRRAGIEVVFPIEEWDEERVKETLRCYGLSTKSLESLHIFGTPRDEDVAEFISDALEYAEAKCDLALQILASGAGATLA
jgi:hypothetical protein